MLETTNLKLKKWQSTDLVTDMLTWLNSNADTIDANISLLQKGVAQFTAQPQMTTIHSVTFPKPYTTPPVVVATEVALWPADRLTVLVYNITTIGAEIRIHNASASTPRSITVNWIAVGI